MIFSFDQYAIPLGLVCIVWSGDGLWGAGALWAVAFDARTDGVAAGLLFGIVAMVPAIVTFSPARVMSDIPQDPYAVAMFSPIVVAIVWLVVIFKQETSEASSDNDSVMDE